jgi:membrane protease YdiL (CAAX protease family)
VAPRPGVVQWFVLLAAFSFLPALAAPGASAAARLVWSELFGLAALSAIAATGANLAPGPFLRLARPRPAALAVGALLGLAGFAVVEAVAVAWVAALPRHLLEQFDVGRAFDQPLAARLAFAAAATVVAPVCEELAFRGYLLSALARRGPLLAIGLSSLLFAAIHVDPVRFPAVLLLGLLYGWIAWRAGSIWPSAVAHVVNNGIVSAVALVDPGERLADVAPTRAEVASALTLGAVGLIALVGLLALLRRLTARAEPGDAVVIRDPTDQVPGFRWARVPPALVATVPVALLTLALLALAGLRAG